MTECILFALLSGYVERTIYDGGYRGRGPKLFGWLRVNYHLPLGALWLLFCVSVGEVRFFPAMCVLEDVAFFTSRGEWPGPDSWISKPLGGVYVGVVWVPGAYYSGILITAILYLI